MATIPLSRLEQVIERFEEVEARMGATTESDEIVALSREPTDSIMGQRQLKHSDH